uniref:Venom S1 protease 14 n=1 Tax=Oncocephalus sp. TaxID=2944721 RepID=A0AB38ZEL6_9HEMI
MLRTLISIWLFYCSVDIIRAQDVIDVALKQGEPYGDLKGAGYPNEPMPYNYVQQWNLAVEDDSTIMLYCDDIRMAQHGPWTPECALVQINIIEDGKETKICGQNKGGYQYKSKGPKLTVKFIANGGSGFIKCVALNTREPPPTQLELIPNGRVKIVQTPKEPKPYFDQVWVLTSPQNTRISLQCTFSLGHKLNDKCYKDKITIDTGNEQKEYCDEHDIVTFSSLNYAKIRIQLNEFGDRRVRCIVQAVTGPDPNEFKNVKSEEVDSSEFGITKGAKTTTCDCGRANRPPGRVTYGKETIENEFPWMVLLHIYYPHGNGMIMFSCGASIITARHVLTAAHCITMRKRNITAEPGNVRMVLAEHNRHRDTGKEVEVTAERLYIHEKYMPEATHDIAVIFTKQLIKFDILIGPVCLTPVQVPIMNRRIQIMGWGQTEHGRGSDVLLKSKALVIDRLICGMNEWEICTHSKPSATCFGDSGGPQVWVDPETNRYTQVSLASKAHKDCYSGPNTQSDVTYFHKWILDIIKESDSTQTVCQKVDA